MAMVQIVLRMALSWERRAEVLEILRSQVSRTIEVPGCLECRLSEDLLDGSIIFEELWGSEEDFRGRVHSAGFRSVLLIMDMAVSEPEFRFYLVSEFKGMKELARILQGE